MKSKELFALPNLAEYKLTECHYVVLKHRLMGTFPALFTKTKEMFVCTELETLKKILPQLPPRKFRIIKSLMLVNELGRHAFSVSALNDYPEDAEPARVLLAEDLQIMMDVQRVMDPPLFKWAPGLVGDDMSSQEFAETIQSVLAHNPV